MTGAGLICQAEVGAGAGVALSRKGSSSLLSGGQAMSSASRSPSLELPVRSEQDDPPPHTATTPGRRGGERALCRGVTARELSGRGCGRTQWEAARRGEWRKGKWLLCARQPLACGSGHHGQKSPSLSPERHRGGLEAKGRGTRLRSTPPPARRPPGGARPLPGGWIPAAARRAL